MVVRLTGKHLLMLVCALLIAVASARVVADGKRNVSDLRSECRWTDSCFIAAQADGRVIVNNNAHLSQWPSGHDVRLYADGEGVLHVTYYPAPVNFYGATIK